MEKEDWNDSYLGLWSLNSKGYESMIACGLLSTKWGFWVMHLLSLREILEIKGWRDHTAKSRKKRRNLCLILNTSSLSDHELLEFGACITNEESWNFELGYGGGLMLTGGRRRGKAAYSFFFANGYTHTCIYIYTHT
jgi:hypothetical protein